VRIALGAPLGTAIEHLDDREKLEENRRSFFSTEPIPYMQDTDATITTSSRSSSARVAACRMRSICSLTGTRHRNKIKAPLTFMRIAIR
jgi:hypothetical protein